MRELMIGTALICQRSEQDRRRAMLCFMIPVVPHKAVAEVSRIGHYRRD